MDMTSFVPDVSVDGILNGILGFLLLLLAVGAIGLYIWHYRKKKKFSEYKIIIWEKDSTGNTHEYYDRAGIFLDKKTGFRLLFLERLKKGLNPNEVPYVTSKDKKGRLVKTVYLRKIGESNYVFCKVRIGDDNVKITVGEEDVNWLAQEMQKVKNTFGIESVWSKFAPYILFIITIVIVMVVTISLFGKFTILEQVSNNMLKISENQEKTMALMLNITENNNMRQIGAPIIVPSAVK